MRAAAQDPPDVALALMMARLVFLDETATATTIGKALQLVPPGAASQPPQSSVIAHRSFSTAR